MPSENIMEIATKEIEKVYGIAMREVQSLAQHDSKEALLRRFSKNYDTMNVEEIMAVQRALGHKDTEEKPCKACRIMARREYELAED